MACILSFVLNRVIRWDINNKTAKRKATLGFPIFRTDKPSFFRGFKDGLSVGNIGKLQVALLFAVLLLMSIFLSWIKQQDLAVVILYKNNKIEGVVLNKVCILGTFFYPLKQARVRVQTLSGSPIPKNWSSTPPPRDKNWPKLLTFMLLAVFLEIMPVIMQFAICHGGLLFDFE